MKPDRAMIGASQPFTDPRDAALALLSRAVQLGVPLERKVAQFLGCCAGCGDLTPRMLWWLRKLLAEAGLPGLAD